MTKEQADKLRQGDVVSYAHGSGRSCVGTILSFVLKGIAAPHVRLSRCTVHDDESCPDPLNGGLISYSLLTLEKSRED
jgi:hypothetical protein